MKKNDGFTFIEMIIAATIFAIIAVTIYSTFSAGIRMWLKTSPMIEENQALRVFFDTIALDIKNAVPYYGKSAVVTTPKFGESSEGKLNFEGAADRISFVTILHEEPFRITYIYDKKDKAVKRLVSGRNEGLDEKYADSTVMLENLEAKDFDFKFCYKSMVTNKAYEYEWQDEWDEKNAVNIPRGVRVHAGKFTKTIFSPDGTLGEKK